MAAAFSDQELEALRRALSAALGAVDAEIQFVSASDDSLPNQLDLEFGPALLVLTEHGTLMIQRLNDASFASWTKPSETADWVPLEPSSELIDIVGMLARTR